MNVIRVNQLICIYKSLINIMQENNWEITTKKGKGKLPLFLGIGKRWITIYELVKTGNLQETQILFCINPGHVLKISNFTEYPMPENFAKNINKLGKKTTQ